MTGSNSGYIKLFRSLLDWEWYDDTNTVRVWVHLLIKANHKPKRWRGVEIGRGQLVTSIGTLSEELNLSPHKIRRALNNLKSTGEIASKTTNKFTLITVEKYSDFQDWNPDDRKQERTQNANKTQTNRKQTATNNNNNKENKEIIINARTRAGAKRSSSFSFEEQLNAIIEGEEDD